MEYDVNALKLNLELQIWKKKKVHLLQCALAIVECTTNMNSKYNIYNVLVLRILVVIESKRYY